MFTNTCAYDIIVWIACIVHCDLLLQTAEGAPGKKTTSDAAKPTSGSSSQLQVPSSEGVVVTAPSSSQPSQSSTAPTAPVCLLYMCSRL